MVANTITDILFLRVEMKNIYQIGGTLGVQDIITAMKNI